MSVFVPEEKEDPEEYEASDSETKGAVEVGPGPVHALSPSSPWRQKEDDEWIESIE